MLEWGSHLRATEDALLCVGGWPQGAGSGRRVDRTQQLWVVL